MQESTRSTAQIVCGVRAPEARDYARMAELATQLGYPSTGEQVRLRLNEMRGLDDYAVFVAEVSGGRIAGWIDVHMHRAVQSDACPVIGGLIVDQEIRSQGVGKVLLNAAEQWARNRGCNVISVLSNIKRDRAHGFYESNGYEHVKTQKSFRKTLCGEPAR